MKKTMHIYLVSCIILLTNNIYTMDPFGEILEINEKLEQAVQKNKLLTISELFELKEKAENIHNQLQKEEKQFASDQLKNINKNVQILINRIPETSTEEIVPVSELTQEEKEVVRRRQRRFEKRGIEEINRKIKNLENKIAEEEQWEKERQTIKTTAKNQAFNIVIPLLTNIKEILEQKNTSYDKKEIEKLTQKINNLLEQTKKELKTLEEMEKRGEKSGLNLEKMKKNFEKYKRENKKK